MKINQAQAVSLLNVISEINLYYSENYPEKYKDINEDPQGRKELESIMSDTNSNLETFIAAVEGRFELFPASDEMWGAIKHNLGLFKL